MTRYDEAFLDELVTFWQLATGRYFWLSAVLRVIPTFVVFKVDSGALFVLYFATVCLLTRSARMGGLIGWFVAAQTAFIYYNYPLAEHFIEILMRASAGSGGTIPSSEQVLANIPATFSGKFFFSLVFGVRAGAVGLGFGFLG
ncbi:hypothetical protein [Accumulibacter sp.]|uniref:hypothetical protein n=1 Tax=Accumulibacter sp. TaxID=2053492 RepID=UPI00260CCB86|nr:hypothetical protein [Accumulibacter sp.]